CAFRPIVDDLERDLQTLFNVNGIRRGVQTAVRNQAANATDPHIHSHANFRLVTAGGSRYQQRLGGVHGLAATGSALTATPFSEVDDPILVEAVADQCCPNQENEQPVTLFDFQRHGASSFHSCSLHSVEPNLRS